MAFHAAVHTQCLPSSPSTQQATRKHLQVLGLNRKLALCAAASDCHTSASSSASASASPTQHFTRKHSPRAFSDCQRRRFSSSSSASSSSSSSTQVAKTNCLPTSFSDFQVQGFPSPPSIQHVHFTKAFFDFQASSSSPSSTTQNVKRKHLPMAFIDYRTQGFSFFSSTQHSTRMHLRRAFSNRHRRFTFILVEQQQPPTLSVRTSASVGRLAGAIHGSNTRRGRPRKRADHDDNPHGKEIVGEPTSENTDGHMFSDDVPYDRDSEYHIHSESTSIDQNCIPKGKEIVGEPTSESTDYGHMFSDDVPYDKDSEYHTHSESVDQNCTGNLHSSTYMYDSVHGGFWQMDPYYQEFENFENEMARQGQVLDGSTPDRSNDISIVSEKHLVEILDVGSSQSREYLPTVQGRNGAAIAYESIDISESRSVFPATATEGSPSPFKDTYKSVEEPFSFNSVKESTAQDFVGTLERDQQCILDPEKCLSQKNERGNDMVREVGDGERPSLSLGSLQSIEGTCLESRQCSGNNEVYVECRSFTEAGVVDSVGGDLNTSYVGASVDSAKITEESGDMVTEVATLADAQTLPVLEQVEKLPAQVSEVAEQVMLNIMDQIPVEQVGQVAEQVTQTAEQIVEHVASQVVEPVSSTASQIVEHVASQVVEPVSSTASQIVNLLSSDEDVIDSDDEFEAYASLDIPEFKGRQGLSNFIMLQGEQGIMSIIYDFYIYMLKRPLFEFMLGMFAAPILLSVIFTILYLPEFSGLALDDTVREVFQNSELSSKGRIPGLQLSCETIFQVFMFSVSLSTGLQPELAPLSPYTLVVANLNALFAQLIFVFLSGAVFARLSQPSQPVKCSTIAIICPPPSNRRLRKEACHKALLTRYVLAGPQPCELVDVKVDLTYNYNTVTRSGTYFRTSQSLKLVRPEVAFLNKGMLVRHIIDETSPLYQRTPGMLEKEDAVFSLSVVGLERSSMQSVFHVEHYCVYDNDLVWDAEFVDMILISKKNKRVVDYSLLSKWRTVIPR